MEVHHHPDLAHREKPWKEYLLEGLMIFLAVSLGFIAENIREHISEQNKKKELLEIVSQDFVKDLDQLIYHENYAKEKLDMCKKLLKYFEGNHNTISQNEYYHGLDVIKGWWFFNPEEKSRIEAESKGYFYMKENSELANVIIRFNFFKNDYKNTEEHEEKLIDKLSDQITSFSDFNVYYKQNRYPEPAMSDSLGIVSLNKSQLLKTKYILSNIIVNNDNYLNDIDSMKVYANKAIQIINNQYP
jgi:hypothetical protein